MNSIRILLLFLCASISAGLAHDDHDHHHDEHEGRLKAEIPGANTGMVEDRLIGGKDVTAIPLTSVFVEDGKNYVWIQDEDDPDHFARWEVTLGRSDGRYVEARTGVFPGDSIVLDARPAVAARAVRRAPQTQQNYDSHEGHNHNHAGHSHDHSDGHQHQHGESHFADPVVPQNRYPRFEGGSRFVPAVPVPSVPVPSYSERTVPVPVPHGVKIPDRSIINEYLKFMEQRNISGGGSTYICPHGRVHRIPHHHHHHIPVPRIPRMPHF